MVNVRLLVDTGGNLMNNFDSLKATELSIPDAADVTITVAGSTSGYDGHCLRAYSYFSEQMPDIDPSTVNGINSIKKTHDKLRSKSKGPSFAMQYMGTPHTLVTNAGFTIDEAKRVYDRYHTLYKVSDAWTTAKIHRAAIDGCVTLAFGLKLRCAALPKTILDSKFTPQAAKAEERTLANAVGGQSYGLLNSRAGVEFQQRTLNSPYRYDVKPVAQIHDAIYLLVRAKVSILEWVNTNLIECMAWNELPELQYQGLTVSSEIDICYQSWAQPITIPNGATASEIKELCQAGKTKYEKESQN